MSRSGVVALFLGFLLLIAFILICIVCVPSTRESKIIAGPGYELYFNYSANVHCMENNVVLLSSDPSFAALLCLMQKIAVIYGTYSKENITLEDISSPSKGVVTLTLNYTGVKAFADILGTYCSGLRKCVNFDNAMDSRISVTRGCSVACDSLLHIHPSLFTVCLDLNGRINSAFSHDLILYNDFIAEFVVLVSRWL